MKVNVQYAETHLADLIAAASRGEIVEIDTPVACAQIYASPKPAAAKMPARRILGAGRGEMRVPSDEEWRAMDKQLERLMNDSPILPLDDCNDPTVWTEPAIPRSEIFGCLRGKIQLADDWDSHETNAEFADMFEKSKLFPELN
jgi:antitoxin (DNA-binding transcriptional repressor) of toxin-antitoxin stability system